MYLASGFIAATTPAATVKARRREAAGQSVGQAGKSAYAAPPVKPSCSSSASVTGQSSSRAVDRASSILPAKSASPPFCILQAAALQTCVIATAWTQQAMIWGAVISLPCDQSGGSSSRLPCPERFQQRAHLIFFEFGKLAAGRLKQVVGANTVCETMIRARPPFLRRRPPESGPSCTRTGRIRETARTRRFPRRLPSGRAVLFRGCRLRWRLGPPSGR
jgi:hypothetical protein